MKIQNRKWFLWAVFCAAGWVNGIFGAGGGMLLVPALKKSGLEQHQAHAASLFAAFSLSVVSVLLYLSQGRFSPEGVVSYLPGGVLGALTGALLMEKIPPAWLRRVFGGFLLFAGGRLLLR